MTIFLYYLLAGVFVSLVIELGIRSTGEDVKMSERLSLISLWPAMILIVLFFFFKALFYDE